jgi:hypothetical protein
MDTYAPDFHREAECSYDGESYAVRDNGSVLRHPQAGKRPRPTDNHWTFGKPNDKTGYMEIAAVRVHRIVATAFHGTPPTPEHVVDHIDTNRRNNRPENLRWLTRLENALLNPVTVKRIELVCGSVEAFLADPSKLRGNLMQNLSWMRTVTAEEAQACRERMHLWAKSDKALSGGSLGEWVFKPLPEQPQPADEGNPPPSPRPYQPRFAPLGLPQVVMALTPGAAQRKWRIPSEFPCCPQSSAEKPLVAYAENLRAGSIFATNHLSETAVVEMAVADDGQSLWVMCEQQRENSVKPWSLAQITYEDGLYVHTSHGTFFAKDGAEKQFCLARGLEWAGGDSIDDYC